MKKLVLGFSALALLCSASAQNVNYVLEIVQFEAANTGCTSDGFGFDEEVTWHCWAQDNGTVSVWTNDSGNDCYGKDDNVPMTLVPSSTALLSQNNTAATTVDVRLEAWEDDNFTNPVGSTDRCDYNSGDDCYSDNSQTINFRNDPMCTWNQYTVNSGDFDVIVRIKWEYTDFNAVSPITGCDTQTALSAMGSGEWSIVTGTGGSFSNQLDTNATFFGTPGETYNLEWSLLPGCMATWPAQNVTVNMVASPVPNLATTSQLCENTNLIFTADNGVTYEWSEGSLGNIMNTSTSGIDTVFNVTAASLPIYVTVTDANGCVGIDSVTFALNPSPVMSLGNDTTICPGTSVQLDGTASGLNNYLWNTGEQSSLLDVTGAGTYICSVTSSNGCTFSDTAEVMLFAAPPLNLGNDVEFCIGDTVTLDAGSGYVSYMWNDASTAQTYVATAFGYVGVTVTDNNTCTASDSVLFSPTYTNFQLYSDTSIFLGTSIDLMASTGVSYDWSTGETTQTITVSPIVDETYTVTIEQPDGCYMVGTVNVLINEEANLFIPNMFSPNGDQTNDNFLIYGNGIESLTFRIFNRWGELVYETTDLTEMQSTGWDGTFNGEDQPTGTYVWTLEGTTIEGNALQVGGSNKGTLLLRR